MSPTKTKAHRRSEPFRSLASSAYLDFKFRLALQESSFLRGSTRHPNRALQKKKHKTAERGDGFRCCWKPGRDPKGRRRLEESWQRSSVRTVSTIAWSKRPPPCCSAIPVHGCSQAPESIEATGHDTLMLWIGPKEGFPAWPLQKSGLQIPNRQSKSPIGG